jgi:hypothetical protein
VEDGLCPSQRWGLQEKKPEISRIVKSLSNNPVKNDKDQNKVCGKREEEID